MREIFQWNLEEMNQAQELIGLVEEISQRKKQQFEDQLRFFRQKLKTNPSDKKLIQDAIKGTEIALEGKKVPDNLLNAIFKALEL